MTGYLIGDCDINGIPKKITCNKCKLEFRTEQAKRMHVYYKHAD